MRRMVLCFTSFVLFGLGVTAGVAAPVEKRIAFVVGNESYAAGALLTAANDAGLVAQTLQAAGFEVVGARDLDAETFRKSYADFLKRVGADGPDTVAFVYLSGYGLQYGNDNYYAPIGANVSRDLDIPIEAIRLSDLVGPLNAMNLKARFMVFDTAYKAPFKINGAPLAGGLALVDASPGSLIAYNSAPGTVALPGKGNYGIYAQSLAAMMREGGLEPDQIFDRVRLRVNDQTKGAVVPWDSTKIDTAFRFFDRAKDAPPPAVSADQFVALRTKPLKDLPVQQAYTAAVARDTLQSYSEFDAVYGGDPLAKRVRVLLAVRREAITWRRSVAADTPDAYWSYLSRYPRGAHAADARLRLQDLAAALAPPPSYRVLAYDVPPPPQDEAVYIDQPVVYFDDPSYDFPPPPPPPDYWLPPVPVDFIDLPPPPPPYGLFFLPVPAYVPLPAYYGPPAYVAYPQNNYFYAGNPGGGAPENRLIGVNTIHTAIPVAAVAAAAVGGAVAARALGVGLPGAAQQRSTLLQQRGITTPAQLGAAQGGRVGVPAAQQLPGANGRALPATNPAAPTPAATNPAPTRPATAATPNPTGRPNAAAQRVQTPVPAPAAAPAATRTNAVRETQTRQNQVGQNQVRQNQARQNQVRQNQARQDAVRQKAQVQRNVVQQRQPAVQSRATQPARPQAQQFRAPPAPQVRSAPPPQFRAPPQARPGGGGGRPAAVAPRPAAPAPARPARGKPVKPPL